jgi:hypothetical protein
MGCGENLSASLFLPKNDQKSSQQAYVNVNLKKIIFEQTVNILL